MRKENYNLFNRMGQQGQTMIETLVAVFMLVMGVSAALGLAIYALNSSTNITKQITAVGLAREGLEAVKNMRDSNWLQQTAISKACYNYLDGNNTAYCYNLWLGDNGGNSPFYCLDPKRNNGVGNCNQANNNPTTADFFLGFDSNTDKYWIFEPQRVAPKKFGLKKDVSTGNFKDLGIYNIPDNNGVVCADGADMSDFCRKITITKDTTPPYNQNVGEMLKVQSFVWWVDKKCPRAADYNLANPSCRLEMDMYLTNWKNY